MLGTLAVLEFERINILSTHMYKNIVMSGSILTLITVTSIPLVL